jgi:hypothetical protein
VFECGALTDASNFVSNLATPFGQFVDAYFRYQ